MTVTFYSAGLVALVAAGMAVTRRNAVHAALYLIVALLAIALVFFALGAPFAAALEVIVYAGAIMVLFVFVVMMLGEGEAATRREAGWLAPRAWLGPVALTTVLAIELVWALLRGGGAGGMGSAGGVAARAIAGGVAPAQVARQLFGPYVLAVELASFLLLAGLVGVLHLGGHARRGEPEPNDEAAADAHDRQSSEGPAGRPGGGA
jgi:NADH-quinone oxidoreductase subunit J